MPTSRPDLYFFHIQKTAGTSVADLIRTCYPAGEIIPAYECQSLVRIPRAQINSYRCFIGHFGTGLFSLVDRELSCVTILRDPFEQVLSHMRHADRITKETKLVDHFGAVSGRWVWEKFP